MSGDRLFGVVVRPLQAFLRLQAASGILLLASTIVALVWANVHEASYRATFDASLSLGANAWAAHFTLRDLIDEGLMTIFFFVVGMEIKRELVVGELDSIRKATLPAVAALGGMVLPAAIFLAFNWRGPGARGWGIPMATDIAFAVGILTLLKNRVPHALVVFVTALAIFDDIGGILVIALFYGRGLHLAWLFAALVLILVLFVMNRAYVASGVAYALLGAGLWYVLHHAGIHATIAGVVLGLMIPARPPRRSREVLRELSEHVTALDRKPPDEELDAAEILGIEDKLEDLQAPVPRFVHVLHPFVAFLIVPIFALASSGVVLRDVRISPVALGTAAGLFLGKLVGIFFMTMIAVKLGLAPMPGGASWKKLLGVSFIAGIGFTVAMFIAVLAYPDAPDLLSQAKTGILLGSLAAGVFGAVLLRATKD